MIPCAHCGEDLPDDATFCRACGSDFETGWNEDADYYSLELPDPLDAPATASRKGSWVTPLALIVAVALIVPYALTGRRSVGTLILIVVAGFVTTLFVLRALRLRAHR